MRLLKRIVSGMMLTLLFLGILFFSTSRINCQEGPIIKILDAQTGSNSTAFGSSSAPIPLGGYPFTVNVTLEGETDYLFTYQVGVAFDRTKVRCTGAQVLTTDPNFVFFGKQTVQGYPKIDNLQGNVVLGSSLVANYANVSRGLLCQINFTAIKTGTSAIVVIPTESPYYPKGKDTFLWNMNMTYISFTRQSFSVTVIAGPTDPVASFAVNPPNPQAKQNVTFDASESYDPNGEIVSYFWDFGDGTNETTTNITVIHSFSSKGIYFVNLTVTDNETLFNSIEREIQVGVIPCVSFTYEPIEIMPLELVTFDASGSYDDETISSYHWDFGDGNVTTVYDAILTHIFSRKGIFWVNLTVYDNDSLHNSTMQQLLVGPRPIANFTFTPENPRPNESVTFDASQSHAADLGDNITLLVWDFGDYNTTEVNIANPGVPNPWIIQHVYIIQGGVFPVNLTVYDNNGLYNSYIQNVTVQVVEPGTKGTDITMYIVAGTVAAVIIVAAVILKKRHTRQSRKRTRR